MYKSTFLIYPAWAGVRIPHSPIQRGGTWNNESVFPFHRNYPGKNGQKIGMMITLAMNVITQSGTPTFT